MPSRCQRRVRSWRRRRATASVCRVLDLVGGQIHQVSVLKASEAGVLVQIGRSDIEALAQVFADIDAVGLHVGFHACDVDAIAAFNLVSGKCLLHANCSAWDEFGMWMWRGVSALVGSEASVRVKF